MDQNHLPSRHALPRCHQGSYNPPQARPELLLNPGALQELQPHTELGSEADPTITITLDPTHTLPHNGVRDIQQTDAQPDGTGITLENS